jgi:hypothetical protein
VLIEHGRGTALDGTEAQLPSGGERLSKECTRTISVAGAAPQNEHATPLEPGAGKPRRRGHALIRRLGVGEVPLSILDPAQGRGEQAEKVGDRSEPTYWRTRDLVSVGKEALV